MEVSPTDDDPVQSDEDVEVDVGHGVHRERATPEPRMRL